MWKMPIAQMRTKYLEHQNLVHSQQVRFRQARQQPFHHLGHTKLECDVPTRVGVKYTSRACCRPNQSSVVLTLQAQSLPRRYEPHLLMLLQGVQPLRTIALINVVQPLYRNVNSDQLREYKDVSQQRCDLILLAWQQRQHERRSDPCRRTQCHYLP